MTGDKTKAVVKYIVRHVDQYRKRPDNIKLLIELQSRGVFRGNQHRLFVLQVGLLQFLFSLLQYVLPHINAVVVARLEIFDHGDAAAKCAATHVKEKVLRFQPDAFKKLNLEVAFHLPQVSRPDQLMSFLSGCAKAVSEHGIESPRCFLNRSHHPILPGPLVNPFTSTDDIENSSPCDR